MTSEQSISDLLNILSTSRSWIDCKGYILQNKNSLLETNAEKILDSLVDQKMDNTIARIVTAIKLLIKDIQRLGIDKAIALRTHRHSLILEWETLEKSQRREDPKEWEWLCEHPDLQILPIEFRAEMLNRTAAAFLKYKTAETLQRAIDLWENAIEIVGDKGESFSYHTNLGTALTRIPEKLEQAVNHHRKALSLVPAEEVRRIGVIRQLEYSLKHLYKQKNDPALSHELVRLQEQRLKADPKGFAAFSTSLAFWMYNEFERTHKLHLLDGAIEISHLILQHLSPVSVDRLTIISNLGSGYAARYNVSGQINDLEKGIKLIEQAIQIAETGSSEWFEYRRCLANALKHRYDYNGDVTFLAEAVRILEDVVKNCKKSDENYPEMLNSYASILDVRGAPGDLKKAIDLWEEACLSASPNSESFFGYQHNLAATFRRRYESSQDIVDLEKAENVSRKLIKNPKLSLSNAVLFRRELCMILRTRFRVTNEQVVLDEAIGLARELINMLQLQQVEDAEYMADLCELLFVKYESTLQIESLLEAKQISKYALAKLKMHSPGRDSLLVILGKVLHELYNCQGDQANLDSAVEMLQEAVDHTPPKSKDLPSRLNSLAYVLKSRFDRFLSTDQQFRKQRVDDLNRAINAAEFAVSLKSNDSWSSLYLSTLATLLQKRILLSKQLKEFWQILQAKLDDKNDVDLSIFPKEVEKPDDLPNVLKYSREAVLVAASGTIGEFAALNNLGATLIELAETESQPVYLEEAITCLERANKLADRYPSGKARNATALAWALEMRNKLNPSKADENRALELKQSALESHSLSDRFSGAYSLGLEMLQQHRFSEAAKAFEIGIDAAKQLLSSQLLLKDKKIRLREVNEVWKFLALTYARNGDLEKAVERIEEGINRQLQEALSLEEYIGNSLLEKGYKDLYTKYTETLDKWNQLADSLQMLREAELRDEQISQQLLTARKNVEGCILEIRKLPEFEQFDAPVTAKDIRLTAVEGPIVYIIPSSIETFALLIFPENNLPIRLLSLPNVGLKDIASRSRYWDFHNGLINHNKKKDREELFVNFDQASQWLWDTVMEPITKELVNYPMATLIPVGLLSFFPLHVSWTTAEHDKSKRNYAQNEICFSYASCARALKVSRQIASNRPPNRLLGIVEPTFSKVTSLPFAELEVNAIKPYFHEVSLIQREQATRENLLKAISDCDVFHFSGHGSSNLLNPSKSCLFLANDQQLMVHDILTIHSKKFSLAFLSACETGMTGLDLPEEAIGLTSGLQQAGFAAVCSSLWPVQEESTMLLTTQFYRFWIAGKMVPAVALQKAAGWVKKVTNKQLTEFYEHLMDTLTEEAGNAYDLAAERWSYYVSCSDPKNCPFSHPFYWGAFTFNGAGFITAAIPSTHSQSELNDVINEEKEAVEAVTSSLQPAVNLPSAYTKSTSFSVMVHLTENEVDQMVNQGKTEALLSLLQNFDDRAINLYDLSDEFKLIRKISRLLAKTNLSYALRGLSKDPVKQNEIRLLCAHAYATQCGKENALLLFQELGHDESLSAESRLLAAQAIGRLGEGDKAADLACIVASNRTIEIRMKAATLVCELANIGLWGTPFLVKKSDLLPELGILVPVDKLATEALIAFQSRDYASALQLLNECIQGGGDDPIYFFNRGMMNFYGQHYQAAINDFTQAIARDDVYEKAFSQRGIAYAAIDEHEMGIKDLSHAIKLNKYISFNYEQRGRSFEALGRHKQAREDFEMAAALAKENRPEPKIIARNGAQAPEKMLSKEKANTIIRELNVYNQICLRLKEMVYETGELDGRVLAIRGLGDLHGWALLTMIKNDFALPARLRIEASDEFNEKEIETAHFLRAIIKNPLALLDDRRLAANNLAKGGTMLDIKAAIHDLGHVHLDFTAMPTNAILIGDMILALHTDQREKDVRTLTHDSSMPLFVKEVAGECLWGLRQYEESIKVLISVATDANASPKVCWMAINALKEFGYINAIQPLLNKINTASTPDSELKRRVRTLLLEELNRGHDQRQWEVQMQQAWQAFTMANSYGEIDKLIDRYPFILNLDFLDYAEAMVNTSGDSENIRSKISWFKMVPEVNLILAIEEFLKAINLDELKIASQQYPVLLSDMFKGFVYQGLKSGQIDADMKEIEIRFSWLDSLPRSAP